MEETQSSDNIGPVGAGSGGSRDVLPDVIRFAISKGVEQEHSNQVTSLSMLMFDLLSDLHGMGGRERVLLQSAAILHDVGRIGGSKGHHKLSRDIILGAKDLPFDDKDRKVVALVARYHRRSLPDPTHEDLAALDGASQRTVEVLASILRIADGLDRTHSKIVKGLNCEVREDSVVMHVVAEGFSDMDRESSLAKAELFEKVFGKKLILDWFL